MTGALRGARAELLSTDPPYCVDDSGNDRPVHDGRPSGKDGSNVHREVDIEDLGRGSTDPALAARPVASALSPAPGRALMPAEREWSRWRQGMESTNDERGAGARAAARAAEVVRRLRFNDDRLDAGLLDEAAYERAWRAAWAEAAAAGTEVEDRVRRAMGAQAIVPRATGAPR